MLLLLVGCSTTKKETSLGSTASESMTGQSQLRYERVGFDSTWLSARLTADSIVIVDSRFGIGPGDSAVERIERRIVVHRAGLKIDQTKAVHDTASVATNESIEHKADKTVQREDVKQPAGYAARTWLIVIFALTAMMFMMQKSKK